jgi:type VI secretion system Hcp family effector
MQPARNCCLRRREALPEVTLELVKTDANGKEEAHHTIMLKSAIIVAVQEGRVPAGPGYKKERGEQVSFGYERIEFEHKPGKTAAQDVWRQRI